MLGEAAIRLKRSSSSAVTVAQEVTPNPSLLS